MKSKTFSFSLLLSLAIAVSLAVAAQAQTVTYIADFNGTNGSVPVAPLIQATNGNFYGATHGGGAHDKGSIFEVTPVGKIRSIYSFCSQTNCADGQYVASGPILGSDGNLYGVTYEGGNTTSSGTFYKLTLGGKITTLYTFCAAFPCSDGQFPSGIIEGSDSNFYGTAQFGGQFNSGTAFKISPTGKFTLLHTFCSLANCGDGATPSYFPLTQGRDGTFYGVANSGGTATGGGGVVYKMTPAGGYKVIHSFCNANNCYAGSQPRAVVQDANGNLFGTNAYGGSYNTGSIFEITSTGQFIGLYRFNYDGSVAALSGVTLASDGNFYGIAENDNFDNFDGYGTIFQITPAGLFTQLYSSYDSMNGPLFQSTDGSFYGTTASGGIGSNGGNGRIFRLTTGLSPLVETVPVAGKVGKHVLILGNDLTGTTSVTFNGVKANFTVESDTYIKATVPPGATTGVVAVVTRSGTLNSNPQFVVTK